MLPALHFGEGGSGAPYHTRLSQCGMNLDKVLGRVTVDKLNLTSIQVRHAFSVLEVGDVRDTFETVESILKQGKKLMFCGHVLAFS